MKRFILASALSATALFASMAYADTYKIDTKGAHAAINFKIQHLGYSWLTGRFNEFDGKFTFDEKQPEKSSVEVVIQTNSLDSNHAERDKHLKSKDFLNVGKFPQAKFSSTSYSAIDEKSGVLKGTLELNGVTQSISFSVQMIGQGNDPWGGYRAGFSGTATLKLADFDITYNLGPASAEVELELLVEGVRM